MQLFVLTINLQRKENLMIPIEKKIEKKCWSQHWKMINEQEHALSWNNEFCISFIT